MRPECRHLRSGFSFLRIVAYGETSSEALRAGRTVASSSPLHCGARDARCKSSGASRALRRRRAQRIVIALRFSIFEMRFNDLLRFDDFLRQSSALNPQSTDSINAALTALLQP
jgi:hypothetical protein